MKHEVYEKPALTKVSFESANVLLASGGNMPFVVAGALGESYDLYAGAAEWPAIW